MTIAFLGLGGNLGDPIAAMAEALRRLDMDARTEVLGVSLVYRTPPWGPVEQPAFLNACARVRTARSAPELLELCLATEAALHRHRLVRWGPRTIDLDILDFGGEEIHGEHLTLPHPRMAERAFVLVPLAEIAPDLDIAGASVRERLQALDRSGVEVALAGPDWWRGA
ncbi:2-amino-4-hydroxy-6-hydroxymethyldihydropteridine diphosphokinase [Aureimonas sp. ME7]|uniref:2-amino-4-hydroxy-6- hydroxymethyldihydropteridine diphosphokinase n=1 Tax=Aureimonas sp. ME7 TaxID=2744252 RepID=UPI0015F4FA16|nr:2-amino-4-hydroxy-6-hydroxymethyldihydropteridine diphosphokinase [Aureimonas sp. ME7]